MSFYTWHNYGYGICVNNLTINSVERVEKLLALAPEFRKQVHNQFKDCDIDNPTIDDYEECDGDRYLGFATILSEVIYEAEGIELLPCDDFNSCRYLIYPPIYPWQMNEIDLSMTEEKIDELFQKYISIITDTPIEITYQEVENGG